MQWAQSLRDVDSTRNVLIRSCEAYWIDEYGIASENTAKVLRQQYALGPSYVDM